MPAPPNVHAAVVVLAEIPVNVATAGAIMLPISVPSVAPVKIADKIIIFNSFRLCFHKHMMTLFNQTQNFSLAVMQMNLLRQDSQSWLTATNFSKSHIPHLFPRFRYQVLKNLFES